MTEQDRIPFAQMLGKLAEAYSEPITGERIAAYFDALQDRPLERLAAACRDAVRTCQRFPSVAELRKLGVVREAERPYQPQLTESPWSLLEHRAETAYGKAVAAMMQRALAERDGTRRAAIFRAFATEWNEHAHWQPARVEQVDGEWRKVPSMGDPWETMARRAEGSDG